ncbi:GDSL-type esterase/lipase family protein [Alicyclobacillus herbarius]|uniref:GDSL-type esterase/lipase family protein n=1 Tax=Alicyclobacillus herbarius TaxID=122960 RepID=UPI00047D7FC9|nr:GDSL-type esterase/lipase family protein [Alicyclobacillus herbarius]
MRLWPQKHQKQLYRTDGDKHHPRRRRVAAACRAVLAVAAGVGVWTSLAADTVPVPQTAAAKAKTLVALGDSITYGWQLPGSANGHPSPYAYPYLVARQLDYQVKDFAVPGATSGDLLRQLQQPKVKAALRQANTVVIDIGSNDLLQSATALLNRTLAGKANVGQSDVAQFQQALTTYANNLPQIVARIQAQTDAPIVLFDLYNPFPDNTILHNIAEPLLAAANQTVLNTAAEAHTLVASAYQPFNHHQDKYVRLKQDDVHPTVAGQRVLAQSVLESLDNPLWHEPMYYALAPHGAVVRAQAMDTANGISWLHGDQADLVIGRVGEWLEVVTPEGQSGYVEGKSVRLLLRPWNNDSFASFRASVTPIKLRVERPHQATQTIHGFAWSGWIYAPLSDLAHAAGETWTWDETGREARVSTPAVAAWDILDGTSQELTRGVASGSTLPSEPSTNLTVRAKPRLVLPAASAYTAKPQSISMKTRGILVKIDGEDTNLRAQPLVVGGQIYVPAPAFWQALGLPVTGDATPPTRQETVPDFIRRFP